MMHKNYMEVTINAYIGLLSCSIHFHNIQLNTARLRVELISPTIYENFMKNNVSNIKISKESIKPENLP